MLCTFFRRDLVSIIWELKLISFWVSCFYMSLMFLGNEIFSVGRVLVLFVDFLDVEKYEILSRRVQSFLIRFGCK